MLRHCVLNLKRYVTLTCALVIVNECEKHVHLGHVGHMVGQIKPIELNVDFIVEITKEFSQCFIFKPSAFHIKKSHKLVSLLIEFGTISIGSVKINCKAM